MFMEAAAAGAPFNVYLRNPANHDMKSATYAVKAGDALSQELPLPISANGRYSVEVHGPNGFYRSFTGNTHAPAIQAHAAYERAKLVLTGNVQLRLRNPGERALKVAVEDNSYKTGTVTRTIPTGQETSIVLDLSASHGWYDFTVKTDGAESRLAGRVETGRAGFSDPLMGGLV